MAYSPINPTQLTPPRVAFIDERSGAISREWYRFFLSLLTATQENQDAADLTPDTDSLLASYDAVFSDAIQALESTPDCCSETASLDAKVDALSQALEVTPRNELGTMAALQQADVPWLTFNTAPTPVPTAVGSMYWDGGTTMGVQATASVLIRVGEAEYVYAKASSAVTKGQLCYHTGAVGASGVITVAPTPLALADPNQIVGVAAETIALNGFGLIQISGDLRGFNTTGSSVGETWADGDPLYYNPAYVGSFTNVKPSAPNQKTYIGEVTNAGSGASGSIHIRIVPGSVLGGTDSNVQFGTLANGDLIQYDSALQYWKNVASSAISIGTATNLAGGAANRIPYQTGVGTTSFITAPTTSDTYLNWSGTAFQWSSNPLGTVTSVNASGGTTGLTFSGGPITSSGTLTLNGTLAVGSGGTGATTFTSGRLLVGQGTSTITSSLVADNGTIVTVNGRSTFAAPNTSAPAWTTSGINLIQSAATFTDTTSTGTVANVYMNVFGAQTLAASNPITATSLYGTYFTRPVAGANVTSSNRYAVAAEGIFCTTFLNVNSPVVAGGPTFTIDLGITQTTATWTAGGTSGTGTITLGQSTDTQTTNIQAGATASAKTKTINLGTGGLSGSTTAIRIGSTAGTSTTTLNGNTATPAGSTGMTSGFFYIPAAAGAPTGVPTAITGTVPMYYDTTNNKFYVYNGAWKSVTLA